MKFCYVLLITLLVTSGIGAAENPRADVYYTAGINAFEEKNYDQAIDLLDQAIEAYDREGNRDAARDAFLLKKRASWILAEMVLNRTQAEDVLVESLPDLSPLDREKTLEPGGSIQMTSDGMVRYYYGIAQNVAYHNRSIMQDRSFQNNHSEFFDELFPMIKENQSFDGWYGNPHTFIANHSLNLSRELLPDNGILKIWFPLPITTESQKNISMISLIPADYVVSGPETTGDLGEIYFEIPLEEMTGQYLNISVEYLFTTSERRFTIDPDSIGPYDTSSDLYQRYTSSQPNIGINPEITKLAGSIIGGEQNPFRKAELIYEYIIRTYPYSHVPRSYLTGTEIPESTYMLMTGFGDCGTQSILFSALCRSVGIPARAAGGYQLVPGIAGPHFWAEFYLPDYGWIPVDVTIAETADWAFNKTDEERNLFKEYYFGDLDPYRYTIQNDVDISFSPDPGDNEIVTVNHQFPLLANNESREDLELMGNGNSTISFFEI